MPIGLDEPYRIVVTNNPLGLIDRFGLQTGEEECWCKQKIIEAVAWCAEWWGCKRARPAYCEAKFGSPCRAGCALYLDVPEKFDKCINLCSKNNVDCLKSGKCPFKGEKME